MESILPNKLVNKIIHPCKYLYIDFVTFVTVPISCHPHPYKKKTEYTVWAKNAGNYLNCE